MRRITGRRLTGVTRRVRRLWLSPAAAIVAVMGLIALAPPDSGAAGTLLSKGRPATASSSYGGRPPRAANDGSLSTYWMAAGRTSPQRWTVDLGSSKSIGRVVVDWRKVRRSPLQLPDPGQQRPLELDVAQGPPGGCHHRQDLRSGQRRLPVRPPQGAEDPRPGAHLRSACLRRGAVTPPTPTPIMADHYVAKSGDDLSGDGSAGNPWRTVQKAADSVGAGEVVAVAAGVYDERVTIPAGAGGTAARPTQFIAGDAVVVRRGFVVNADYTSLAGFEVTPGAAFTGDPDSDLHRGQIQVNGSHDTFAGFTIHDTPGSGFVVDDDRHHTTIRDFTIRRVGSSGIVTATSNAGGADHTTILNGTIAHDRGWSGIQLTGDYNVVDTVTIVGGPSGTAAGRHRRRRHQGQLLDGHHHPRLHHPRPLGVVQRPAAHRLHPAVGRGLRPGDRGLQAGHLAAGTAAGGARRAGTGDRARARSSCAAPSRPEATWTSRRRNSLSARPVRHQRLDRDGEGQRRERSTSGCSTTRSGRRIR